MSFDELPTEYDSIEKFLKKGTELFGPDRDLWKFECPACHKVTSIKEWKEYAKDKDEASGQIAFSCVGRLIQRNQRESNNPNDPIHLLEIGHMGENKYACNYTTGGLFNLSPVTVKNEDGENCSFFQFSI